MALSRSSVVHGPAALLLDLDGTLVDSEPVHREAYRRFFRARGWEHDDALLALFTGRRADDVFASTPGPWSGEDPTALFHEVVSHHPRDLLPEPVAGARELVDDACARGIPCVLVTSAGRRWAVTALELLGGSERFAAMVTRDDVTEGKPAPDGYLLAIRTLGVRAEDCLVAEDTPAGVRAGRAAGVGTVVGVTTSFSAEALRDAGADLVLPDLHGLTSPA
ncbi:HAD family hydrolase [Arsenicicoccus sp. UBA7492]|uniref:HAD family hydrolase n=1 Tax=Arsenicicoccus sp. UBA7492 TaxID=1946057 RepID=UPI00257B5C2D|nr:HAD family phosphatase [Arsenicicoccus sp. UBA7492]